MCSWIRLRIILTTIALALALPASGARVRIPVPEFTNQLLGTSLEASVLTKEISFAEPIGAVTGVGIDVLALGSEGTYSCTTGERGALPSHILVSIYPAGGAFYLYERQLPVGLVELHEPLQWFCPGPDDGCENPWIPGAGVPFTITLDAGPGLFVGICGPETLAPVFVMEFEIWIETDAVSANPSSWSQLKAIYDSSP